MFEPLPSLFESLDIMSFLKLEYDNYLIGSKEEGTEVESSLDAFVEWARNYLANENQPVNVAYLPMGLGLKLQSGHIVAMRPQDENETGMRDEGIPITRPMTLPGMGMLRTPVVPITGQ